MKTLPLVMLSALLLAVISGAECACADGDIVYAARYYLSPGSHGTSHFHLYRINPDGTGRTQITFGGADDGSPRWSPDGREVLFSRADDLCLLNPVSGQVRQVFNLGKDAEGAFLWQPCHWSPDGRWVSLVHTPSDKPNSNAVWVIDIKKGYVRRFPGAVSISWSPTGRTAYLAYGNHHALWDVRTGRLVRRAGTTQSCGPGGGTLPLWVDEQTLLEWDHRDAGRVFLRSVNLQGRELRRVQLHYPVGGGGEDALDDPGSLWSVPGHSGTLIYAAPNFNSTIGDVYEYLAVDLKTGRMRSLAYGPSLSVSPDGHRFCDTHSRDTAYYSRWHGGQGRDVWVAPLEVGGIGSGTPHTLTPGLVWVTEADWRQGSPSDARR